MDYTQFPNILPLVPEIFLAIAAIGLLMAGVFNDEEAVPTINLLAIFTLIATIVLLCFFTPLGTAFDGAFITDRFARYLKVLTLLGAAVTLAMTMGYARTQSFARVEYPILVLLGTLGMMMMISAGDMIGVYLGLELQSLAIYVCVAINRDSIRSTEAGLKYFVLGALSSGLLLYGISLVYGFTGATEFQAIAAAIGQEGMSLGVIFGLVFILAGSRLQGLGRAVPHVDARRLRGRAEPRDRAARRRAQGRRDGAPHPRRDGILRARAP